MDSRVKAIAQVALTKLGGSPGGSIETIASLPPELRIGTMSLPQLSRLANLQIDDPLVAQVMAMLKAGRPVFLDRPAVEASLGLGDYPPRIQEQFARWFSRVAGYGVALTAGPMKVSRPVTGEPKKPFAPEARAPEVKVLPVLTPERELFSEILGDAVPEPHPCVKDPGVACCGSGRCKTLGF